MGYEGDSDTWLMIGGDGPTQMLLDVVPHQLARAWQTSANRQISSTREPPQVDPPGYLTTWLGGLT